MTPQAFSYATVTNGMIYCPPYGLTESLDYMIKINPTTYEVTKIPLDVDDSKEKYIYGTVYKNKIVFFPYNESRILIVDTTDDSVKYVNMPVQGRGKYVNQHLYENKIISLPYGEGEEYDYIASFDVETNELFLKKVVCEINDSKKWHTSQMLNNKIYAVPRGERWSGNYFPYAIEVDCNNLDYKLTDLSDRWKDYDQLEKMHVKFTTLAKSNNKLYAPPYGRNNEFDVMLMFSNGTWKDTRTNLKETSRKYFTHTVASNGKIYFPPAGHDDDWSEMLIIDSYNDRWDTINLNLGKESKKYFTGCENSLHKIYYIPRGGCVCEPVNSWKQNGDLAEILVIDTLSDTFYTIDVGKYFVDNTTIEKYNSAVIINDKIFAMPYGQSESFQTVLVFDTIIEKVIKTIDLNDI